MKRYWIAALTIVLSTPAFGSKIIGNGGDVLVCENRIPRVQLLDFAETRTLRAKSIQLSDLAGNTYLEKLAALQQKIIERFPHLGRFLVNEIGYFESTNVKLDDLELEDIQDSFHKFHLAGCKVQQIANQSIPLVDDDPSFIIDNELWVELSELDKAGLVLHEVLYRMGLRYSLEHSAGVRYLVSLFFDDNLRSISDKQWIQGFQVSRIKLYEVSGVRFPVFSGNADTCEITPGARDCEPPDEIKPATFSFTPGGDLQSVTYHDRTETLDFRSRNGVEIQVAASYFQFNAGPEGYRVRTTGKLVMGSRSVRQLLPRHSVRIAGEINVTSEQFCGELAFLDEDEKPVGRESYCGDILLIPDVLERFRVKRNMSGN